MLAKADIIILGLHEPASEISYRANSVWPFSME